MARYTFRYPLERRPQPFRSGRLTEVLRQQLSNILDLVYPLYQGKRVRVDGFALLSEPQTGYQLVSKGGRGTPRREGYLSNAALYEPRIEFIQRQLQSLLEVAEMEWHGNKAPVDGFRLRDLRDWLVPSSGDPLDILSYLGSQCQCDCLFCCNSGNPPHFPLSLPPASPEEKIGEVNTRMDLFSPAAGTALFPRLGCEYEVMAHPHFWQVARRLRRSTEGPFRLTTNGRVLTPAFVASLAELKPLYLYLSLNSSSPHRRGQLMGDSDPAVAIRAPSLLREQGIPFATVIVPWPLDSLKEMLADMGESIAYADREGAHLVEIHLPGYSRYLCRTQPFDSEEVWPAIVARVRELRQQVSCPVVVMPSLYEENLYEPRKNLPTIIGVVRGSPAQRAGLVRGDLILGIGSLSVTSRPQARDLLSLLRQGASGPVRLEVKRGGHILEMTLHPEDFSYPYDPRLDRHLGAIFTGSGLRPSYLEDLRTLIEAHGARSVLFLTSAPVKAVLEQLLAESHLFANIALSLRVPQNRFFGGNILMGDLLVVQDFIDCILGYLQEEPAPDLVVIPSSPFHLGGWRRDLTGRVYLDIEREVGIPVELLPCSPIME